MSVLAGTGALVRFILRRDRVRLPVWLLAILGLVWSSASAVQGTYDTPADVAAYARTVGASPASIVMNGPPTAVDTIAGIVIFEINSTAIIATALMAIFLVVRHTRGEEEEGRTELLRAGVVGRYAPIAAALLVVSVACCVVGAGLALALVSLDLPTSGAVAYGGSIAVLGVVFTAVGACAAQVTEHARGALGIAGAVLGVSYLLRGIGDVPEGAGSWLSWLSPIGWSQAVRPFADDRWWPLLLSIALIGVLLVVVGALVSHRDVGAGLVAPRPGSPVASPRLTTAVGFAVRLQRGAFLGWTAGLFLGGIAFGSVGREVEELLTSIPELEDALGLAGAADLVDAFFGTALLILALVGSGFTVGSVLRLRTEESAGRAEPLLATGLSRWRWTLGVLTVTVLGTVAVLGAGGLGAGLAHSIASGDVGQLPRLLLASLAYVPAALVLAGATVVLFGWLPRLTAAAWAALAVCLVIGWLGGVLDIPTWLADLSPFTHVPRAPLDPLTATPLLALTVTGVAAAVVGLVGFRRRDVR
ncbi:MAG: ABC transporter permease [Actinomycetes bacterium]